MCFPVDLFDQFASRIERQRKLDPQGARAWVKRWAEGVRGSGIVPTGTMYDFWRVQFDKAHAGASEDATQREIDESRRRRESVR